MTAIVFLQVLLGLAVVYLLVCMFASAVQELIARLFNQRGRYLRENLQSLLPDRWVYLRVINHPVVSGLYRDVPGRGALPSYIPARNFAQALVDVLVCRHKSGGTAPAYDLEGVRRAVADARDKHLAVGHALMPVFARAKTIEEALTGVEQWFDSSTVRLSGWYKAHIQKMLFVIGLAVAVALNIDTLEITRQLAVNESLRAASAQAAERLAQDSTPAGATAARAELARLTQSGLPIGYACLGTANGAGNGSGTPLTLAALGNQCQLALSRYGAGDWLLKLAGWLLTALATALGAPFWFDLLNRFISLRSAGARPAVDKPAAAER
jgi:hypothetical protein